VMVVAGNETGFVGPVTTNNPTGMPFPSEAPPTEGGITATTIGNAIRFFLRMDGTVLAQGPANSQGQLGNGVTNSVSGLVFVKGVGGVGILDKVVAISAGNVHTLALRSDGIFGDNTDGAGLIADLTRNLAFDIKGTRVLVLGAGGAARGVLGPLLEADPEYLEIANRNEERATELAHEFATLGTVHGCGFDAIADSTFDLVLNATSASLQDTIPPIPPGVIGPTTLCYDMAYGKGDTAFTRWSKSAGAGRAETGWGMLVEQAAESFLLWRGVKPDTAAVIAAVKSGMSG